MLNIGPLTLLFIVVTVLVSLAGFNNESLISRFILWPRRMNGPQDYYRLLTSGFIHNDGAHLFFNMFTLYFMGTGVESVFRSSGEWMLYPVLYLGGIIVASLPSFIKHRNDSYYRSLGASGGVAAVLFSYVYFSPWSKIYVWFIGLPSIAFAVLYLIYSAYSSRRGGDNVNHDAHFWGSVYGFVFTLLVDPSHGQIFLQQVMNPGRLF